MTGENRMRFHAIIAPAVTTPDGMRHIAGLPEKLHQFESVPDHPGWAYCEHIDFGPVFVTICERSYATSIRNDLLEAFEVFDPREP